MDWVLVGCRPPIGRSPNRIRPIERVADERVVNQDRASLIWSLTFWVSARVSVSSSVRECPPGCFRRAGRRAGRAKLCRTLHHVWRLGRQPTQARVGVGNHCGQRIRICYSPGRPRKSGPVRSASAKAPDVTVESTCYRSSRRRARSIPREIPEPAAPSCRQASYRSRCPRRR
jgi:hypothetical protein